MRTFARDLRLAVRVLFKAPAFALLSIATIAAGIGASAAVFSMVNAVLVRPLPFATNGTLIRIRQPSATSQDAQLSTPEIRDYRAQVPELAALEEYHSMSFEYYGRGDPQRVQTGVVSDDFFDVLGVQPILGRTFLRGEEEVGAPPVVVLSYKYWASHLGADPQVVGQTFTMNDRIHTIVGVLPPLPGYPDENDIWMPAGACPFRSAPEMLANRSGRMLGAFGLLKHGARLEAVANSFKVVSARLRNEYPADYPEGRKLRIDVTTVRDDATSQSRPLLYTLLAAAAFVLLVATANFANLVLLRQMTRGREIALRAALGASGGRLFRAIATENLCVTLLGGGAGVLIAYAVLGLVRSLALRVTPRGAEIEIDPTVLAFAVTASVIVGLLAALVPHLKQGPSIEAMLRQGAASATPGRAEGRLRGALVFVQIAVACVVLIAAGLVTRSLLNLEAVAGGFDAKVMTARVDLNWTRYDNGPRTLEFADRLLERLAASPGVAAASLSSDFPLNGGASRSLMFVVRGQDVSPELLDEQKANATAVSAGYFEAAGIPILRGRGFNLSDRDKANLAIVVSARFAKTFLREEPLGQQISWDNGASWATVVGVAGDVRMSGLSDEIGNWFYAPYPMYPTSDIRVLVRGQGGDPSFAAPLIRGLVHELDDKQAVSSIQTLDELRGTHLIAPRVTALLLVAFGVLALAITAAGLIGVVGQSVGQRITEIGVRVALGARPGQVLWSMMRSMAAVIVAGMAAGLVAAAFAARIIAGLLYHVTPVDGVTYAAVAVLLLGLALLACLVAARRALSVEPIEALRNS
jgi:putative ABC transport system permease protein